MAQGDERPVPHEMARAIPRLGGLVDPGCAEVPAHPIHGALLFADPSFGLPALGDTHIEGIVFVGQAIDYGPSNMQQGFFWSADARPEIPIPGAAWLLLSGLVGIIGLRRKN